MPLIEMITINDSEKTPMWEWIHDFCVCLSFCWILLFNECYSCHQWLISWLMITNYVKCCPSAFAFSQAKVKNQLEPKTSFSWSLRARKSNESTKNWNIPPRAVFMKVGGGWRSKRPSMGGSLGWLYTMAWLQAAQWRGTTIRRVIELLWLTFITRNRNLFYLTTGWVRSPECG